MVEMKRTKGGQGKPKRGAENKKKKKGGGVETDAKGVRALRRNEKGNGEG